MSYTLFLLRAALVCVSLPDPLIHALVRPVGVALVEVLLPRIVWWVANDDADLAAVLAPNTLDVLIRQGAQHVVLVALVSAERRDVIQGVHEAEVRELRIFSGDGRVGRLNIQVSDIVGEDRDLVGMQLLPILVAQLLRLAPEVLQELHHKGARTGSGVQYLNITVDQVAAEMALAQPVGRVDHKADDLVRCVDYPKPVCGLGIVNLVEVLVDRLQEALLLLVRADLGGGCVDLGIVGLQRGERPLFDLSRP
jgi:hypothetical protein